MRERVGRLGGGGGGGGCWADSRRAARTHTRTSDSHRTAQHPVAPEKTCIVCVRWSRCSRASRSRHRRFRLSSLIRSSLGPFFSSPIFSLFISLTLCIIFPLFISLFLSFFYI